MALQLLFYRMLLLVFIQYSPQYSCTIAVKPFLHALSQCPCGASCMGTTAAWKKLCFILTERSDFHMTDNQSIAVHVFASRILTSFSIDEMLLLR